MMDYVYDTNAIAQQFLPTIASMFAGLEVEFIDGTFDCPNGELLIGPDWKIECGIDGMFIPMDKESGRWLYHNGRANRNIIKVAQYIASKLLVTHN